MAMIKYKIGEKIGECIFMGNEAVVNKVRFADFRCKCGNIYRANFYNVFHLKSKSCGCVKIDNASILNKRHGLSKTPEFNIWWLMKDRCKNKSNKDYKNYGGRGISVHPSWICSFQNFINDVGRRTSKKHQLDRIDNNGNYEPGNVRWATQKEQSENKRTNVSLTYNGETKILREWATGLGLSYSALQRRRNMGWSVEEMFTTPVSLSNKRKKKK